jgi:hypothetical protein
MVRFVNPTTIPFSTEALRATLLRLNSKPLAMRCGSSMVRVKLLGRQRHGYATI